MARSTPVNTSSDPYDFDSSCAVSGVLPHGAGAERMWRDDDVYDLVVVLGHNDDPPVSPMGSAIFLHLARADYAPTEGCVAIGRADMEALLAIAKPGDLLEVRL